MVDLLHQRNRSGDIDHVAEVLAESGVTLDEITLFKAEDAMRKQDFEQGIALARRVYRDNSKAPFDHLALSQYYAFARQADAAEKEFRRAVELGPGLPECWLAYVK